MPLELDFKPLWLLHSCCPMVTGAGRLAPPPAPPARSPTTELSSRTPPPPPPPPLPPSILRNGHLHSLGKNSYRADPEHVQGLWLSKANSNKIRTWLISLIKVGLFCTSSSSRWLWVQVSVPPCRRLTPSRWIQAFSSDLPQQRKRR